MNQKLLISVTLLVFFAFAVEGNAFRGDIGNPLGLPMMTTGKQFVEACRDIETNINSQSSIACLYYTMGVMAANYDSYVTVSKLSRSYKSALKREENLKNEEFVRGQIELFEGIKRLHCIKAEEVNYQQAILVTLEFLRKNPAELKYNAAGSILTSLGKAFPCSR
tara:strand:- start:49 stop:543 length:495 start_codon:yes stop_codon:yes gene_type:complete